MYRFVEKLLSHVSNKPYQQVLYANFIAAKSAGFAGMGLLLGLIGVAVVLIVLARAFPILWPMVTSAGGNVTAMTGTDAGTTTFVAFWPVVLLVVGIGVAVGLIIFALRSFGLLGGNGNK